ncbi:Mfa1 family fimbria major subunit [Parabacteroides sp.]
MRKIKFFTMLTAVTALMAGVTSCNNDDDPNGGGLVEEGKATQMTVSINFPTGETRATGDPNATNAEATINTVDVFIYNGAGAFLSHTPLVAADFTPAGTSGSADKYTYNAAAKISTTTGTKNVYVGINLPSAVVTAIKSRPMGELATVAQTMTRAQLASNNGLPMFSSKPATSTLVEDDTQASNNVTVQVERLVAKVTVEADASIDITGVPGKVDNLTFAINNFNERLYLVQGASPAFKDPNWDSQTLTASWMTTDFSDAASTAYVNILDNRTFVGTPGVDDYSACYAYENTSKEKLKGEITRATIRATFIPETITVSDGSGGYTTQTTSRTTPATFWAVTPSVGAATAYFETQSVAQSFATDNGGATVEEYTDGYCYWDMFLNKTSTGKGEKWDVLRNEYFKCNITRIVAPGRPDPGVVPPDVTPDDDTKISVNIEVLFWNTPVLADYELAP